MKYLEFDLKVERIQRSENEFSFTVIPSREDSLDRLEEEEGIDFPYEGETVENSVIRQDELVRLREAIQKLDPEERELIEAIFFRRMTERDYGRKIGRPQTMVNYRKPANKKSTPTAKKFEQRVAVKMGNTNRPP